MDPHTLSPPSVKPMATPLGLSINMSLLSTPEMPSATPDGAFTFEKKLGSGSEGTIWEATEVQTGRQVAVKVINRAWIDHYERLESWWPKMEHPHISQVISHMKDGNFYYLVTELCEFDLLDVIKSSPHGRLSEQRAARWFTQLAEGLCLLHKNELYHRDIKPENVLISRKTGAAKLSDFGTVLVPQHMSSDQTSMKFMTPCGDDDESLTSPPPKESRKRSRKVAFEPSPVSVNMDVGSPAYIAPEIHRYSCKRSALGPLGESFRTPESNANPPEHLGGYDPSAADVWSLGVTLFSMVTGSHPWDSASATDSDFQRLVPNGRLDHSSLFPSHLSIALCDLLKRMLSFHHEDRPSIAEIISHPWVTQYTKPTASPRKPSRRPKSKKLALPMKKRCFSM